MNALIKFHFRIFILLNIQYYICAVNLLHSIIGFKYMNLSLNKHPLSTFANSCFSLLVAPNQTLIVLCLVLKLIYYLPNYLTAQY